MNRTTGLKAFGSVSGLAEKKNSVQVQFLSKKSSLKINKNSLTPCPHASHIPQQTFLWLHLSNLTTFSKTTKLLTIN